MKYKDLKTGMDIVCKIDGEKVVGKISISDLGSVFICHNVISGGEVNDTLGYKYSWLWLFKGEDPYEKNFVTDFHFGRTLHDLVEGDILVNEDGNEVKVLGVCGRAIFLSVVDNFDKPDCDYFTAEQLEKWNHKLKDQPTEDTIEIEGGKYTVAELKKLLKD